MAPPQTAFARRLEQVTELEKLSQSITLVTKKAYRIQQVFSRRHKTEQTPSNELFNWYDGKLRGLISHRNSVEKEFRTQALRVKTYGKQLDKTREDVEAIWPAAENYKEKWQLRDQVENTRKELKTKTAELGETFSNVTDWMPTDQEFKVKLTNALPLAEGDIGYTHPQLARALVLSDRSFQSAKVELSSLQHRSGAQLIESQRLLEEETAKFMKLESRCRTLEDDGARAKDLQLKLDAEIMKNKKLKVGSDEKDGIIEELQVHNSKLAQHVGALKIKIEAAPDLAEYSRVMDENSNLIQEHESAIQRLEDEISSLEEALSEARAANAETTKRLEEEKTAKQLRLNRAQADFDKSERENLQERTRLERRLNEARSAFERSGKQIQKLKEAEDFYEERILKLDKANQTILDLQAKIYDSTESDKARDQHWIKLAIDMRRESSAQYNTILKLDRLGYVLNAYNLANQGFGDLDVLPGPPYRLNLIDEFSDIPESHQAIILAPVSTILELIREYEDVGRIRGDQFDDLLVCQFQVLLAAPETNAVAHFPFLFLYLEQCILQVGNREGLRALLALNMLAHLYGIAPQIPQASMENLHRMGRFVHNNSIILQQSVIKLFHSVLERERGFMDNFPEDVKTRVEEYDPNVHLIDWLWKNRDSVELSDVHMIRSLDINDKNTLTIIRDMNANSMFFDKELIFVQNSGKITLQLGRLKHFYKGTRPRYSIGRYAIWRESEPWYRLTVLEPGGTGPENPLTVYMEQFHKQEMLDAIYGMSGMVR